MFLSTDELNAFSNDGLVIKRGFVSSELADRAATLIDEWYRTHLDESQLIQYTQRTFAPHLCSHPDVLALFTQSSVAELARELLGDFVPITTTQIQIRVPEAGLRQMQPDKPMHVDGVACPHLDPAELRTFSLLVGVMLTSVNDPTGGALHYVPGGHRRMAEWFSSEWKLGLTDQVPVDIDAEQGTPVLGKPGDVILMHHLVPHAVGSNHSTSPRIMAYYRVSHVEHANRRLDALRNPWLDYPALAARSRGEVGNLML